MNYIPQLYDFLRRLDANNNLSLIHISEPTRLID